MRLSIIIITIITIITFIPSVYATDSTPSANVRTKLEELKKEIASKAAVLKQEVNKKLTNKAYMGNIKTKSTNSITLASSTGPKMVSINQDTEFTSKFKGKTKIIKEEDFIGALGDVDETGVLIAKRIILLPDALKQKTHLWGQVVGISEKLITLKRKDSKTQSVSLPKDKKVKLNNFIITTGQINEKGVFEANFAHVTE